MSIPINKQARSILTGLVETFDAIDRVNGLEQREAQLQASVAAIAKDEAEARSRIDELLEQAKTVTSRCDSLADEALAEAKVTKAKAEADASALRAAALEAVKVAKAKENAAEAAERKAKASLAEIEKQAEMQKDNIAAALAIIARAEAIKRAMA